MSKSIKVSTRAKINLFLDVTGKRPDGYHDISSVMQALDLGDVLSIYDDGPIEGDSRSFVSFETQGYQVPADGTNLAVKAAVKLLDAAGITRKVRIGLDKKIPVAAGLAGGSSDAAGILLGLRELYHIEMADEDLLAVGASLGADVPFCMRCGTMIAGGIGDRLTDADFLDMAVVVAVPRLYISTPKIYNQYDELDIKEHHDISPMLDAIARHDIDAIAANLTNIFYPIVSGSHRVVSELANFMTAQGALGSMMSGSGPSVFGIVGSQDDGLRIVHAIKRRFDDCFTCVCRTAKQVELG